MDTSSSTARPYAVAVFKLASEDGKLGDWAMMLDNLRVIASDPAVVGLVASPKVSDQQVADLIIDTAGDRLDDQGRNFVRVLAENGRLNVLPAVYAQFERERAKTEGRSRVLVRSAYALDDAQRQLLSSRMSKRLGSEVEIEEEIDESLIGGMVIRAGDMVIDASLRGRLSALRQRLS